LALLILRFDVVELRRINWLGDLVSTVRNNCLQGLLGLLSRKRDFVSSRLRLEHNIKIRLQWDARGREIDIRASGKGLDIRASGKGLDIRASGKGLDPS